ncbi:MAG TPA: hypothetical protein VNI60_06140, partial [Pyrinomonadaceae bacterium]|nr:hypothetical protein [Pyrinomonadaceae bacterium]
MFKKTWKKRKSYNSETDEAEKPAHPINVEKSRTRTFDRAVNLLAFKQRSVSELRTRLLEKDWTNAEIVEEVIEKLAGYG